MTIFRLFMLSFGLFALDASTMDNFQAPKAKDPGVPQENFGTGQPNKGLNDHDMHIYSAGLQRFQEVDIIDNAFRLRIKDYNAATH